MRSWTGSRSPEFGTYPVELHFSLDSHVGPAWVVPALFNRSGWLAVAEVEMETEFDRTRATIAACVNDEGEVLGPWVVEALFSMQCFLPQEVVIEPPDDLSDALDALYWDFLGGCDIAHLQALEEKEWQITSSIGRLEMRRKEVYEKVESFLSGLYARRRREKDRPDLRKRIDDRIEEIESKQAETEEWHRSQLAVLHADRQDFERQVLASLGNHGRLLPLYTVYWQTRHSKVRTLGNAGFELRFGLPKPETVETNFRSLELEAKLHRMAKLERKRQEFSDYYEALENALDEIGAQKQATPKIAEVLTKPNEPVVSRAEWIESFRTTDFRDLAAKSRAWQARHGHAAKSKSKGQDKKRRKRGAVHPATRAGQVFVKPKPKPARDATAIIATPTVVSIPDTATPAAGLVTEAMAHYTLDEDALLQELQLALEEDATREREAAFSGAGSPPSHGQAETEISIAAAEAFVAGRPSSKVPALRVAPKVETFAATGPEPVSAPVMIADGHGRVSVGDTILLRFTDGGLVKFIRYTIEGAENDASRGILAINDPRAQDMLGKQVGDVVVLGFPTIQRTAAIETITREGAGRLLTAERRSKPQRETIISPLNLIVEPGDTVVLRYFEGRRQHFYHCLIPIGCGVPTQTKRSRKTERARAMLGKQVGDEFSVWLGSVERPVRIDRILKP